MNKDISIASLDRGVKLPLLYNLGAAVLTIIFTFSHLIFVSRVLSHQELLIYGSISTLYSVVGLLVSRHLQWGARIFIREGRGSAPDYAGLTTLGLLISLAVAPIFIHLFIAPLDPELALISILYAVATTYFYSYIQVVNLVATKYYTFIFLLNYLARLAVLAISLPIFGDVSAYIALLGDVAGHSTSVFTIMLLLHRVVPIQAYLPHPFSPSLVRRTFALSIPQFLLLPRINVSNIHYFIAFFLRIGEAIINSLWIVYKLLSWGRSFFRGFFSVIYARQFYGGLDNRVFREYIDFLVYLTTPMIVYSFYIHAPIVSLFKPEYIGYSYLVPFAVSLLLLEILRISLIRIVFGGDDVDIRGDDEAIPKGIFYSVSLLEMKIFLLFIIPTALASTVAAYLGYPEYVPGILIASFIIQVVVEVIVIYRVIRSRWGLIYRSINPLLFILASIPGLLYLMYVDASSLIVRDIFVEGPILALHLTVSIAIYFVASLAIPWVRNHIKILLS